MKNQSLRVSKIENLLNSVINHLDSCVCVFSDTGTILYYNDKFAACFSIIDDLRNEHFLVLPQEYLNISGLQVCLQSLQRHTADKRVFNDNIGSFITTRVITTPVFDKRTSGSKGRPTYIIEEFSLSGKSGDTYASRSKTPDYSSIVISDKAMFEINQTLSRIAYFDSTILIQGESGTGKTALARHIHNNSSRRDKPFITVNCGSIPENLIESELFGYASGAFTGANRKGKAGQVELADGGTLFLDEIGLLPFDLQAKFLQLIQEKTYTPVGALQSKRVNVRIISATNLDLKEQVRARKFREDLYYRLRVIELFIPPLRERGDAIEPLIRFFLEKYNMEFGTKKTITSQAISALKEYNWPGNIRELQYVMERIIVTSTTDSITSNDIPPLHDTETSLRQKSRNIVLNDTDDFEEAVAAFEKELLLQAYKAHHSSYKVAHALGITQSKASRLLRKYGIS